MEKRYVTASLIHNDGLREEIYPEASTLNLPGEFTVPDPTGKMRVFRFKDSSGQPATEMMITGDQHFDLNNPIDNHNWGVLQALNIAHPGKIKIKLENPEEIADQVSEQFELALEIQTKLASMKTNTQWLIQVYRRIIGLSKGITGKIMYQQLMQKAHENPGSFLNRDGEFIYNDVMFELMTQLDNAIEIGFFTKDINGLVRRRSGEIYADAYDKALYRFESDLDTQNQLRFETSGESAPDSKRYVPVVENEALKNLLSEFSEEVPDAPVNEDFSTDTESEEDKFYASIDKNFEELVQREFIEKVRQGNGYKYRIDGLQKLGKQEMIMFLRLNKAKFDDLMLRAKL